MVVEESSPVLLLTLGACALTLLMTLCIVCHRKRQRRRPNINHERRPFAPPPPFDTSSRPSMSLPSDIPSPPPPATLYTSLPPLSIDVGDNVWWRTKILNGPLSQPQPPNSASHSSLSFPPSTRTISSSSSSLRLERRVSNFYSCAAWQKNLSLARRILFECVPHLKRSSASAVACWIRRLDDHRSLSSKLFPGETLPLLYLLSGLLEMLSSIWRLEKSLFQIGTSRLWSQSTDWGQFCGHQPLLPITILQSRILASDAKYQWLMCALLNVFCGHSLLLLFLPTPIPYPLGERKVALVFTLVLSCIFYLAVIIIIIHRLVDNRVQSLCVLFEWRRVLL